MNSTTWVRIAEWGALMLVWLAALGLARWPRRGLAQKAGTAKSLWAQGVLAVLGSAVLPLLALGLGWLVLWLPSAGGVSWAGEVPASHRAAWGLFWLILLALGAVETLALRITQARGGPAMPALLRGVLRLAATALAAFFVLRFELGWNIGPLLASTALLTAVVGFALQGVLGNLLAGMSLNLTGALAHRD